MTISGKVRVDRKTKNLVKRIKTAEIAIIDHADIDEIAALSLVRARVKAVINSQPSITGKYPNLGPLVLLKNNIPLLDNAGQGVMEIEEGQVVEIRVNEIYVNNRKVGQGKRQTEKSVLEMMELSKANTYVNMEKFVLNTLFHANREREVILGDIKIPSLKTSLKGRPVLIVVRGHAYREDLQAVKSYVRDVKPVLIGVDGGADALLEAGYRPDIIFGDMDSVSDRVLRCGAELVVHAYADGEAPGMDRVRGMGLDAGIFAVLGTSEDAAMLLAYHGGAELIVAVGTHSSMYEFFDKGRSGMASTVLTRIKIGSILVDAKGVSKLYTGTRGLAPVLQISLASAFTLVIIASTSTLLSQLSRLFLLRIRMMLGF